MGRTGDRKFSNFIFFQRVYHLMRSEQSRTLHAVSSTHTCE